MNGEGERDHNRNGRGLEWVSSEDLPLKGALGYIYCVAF